MHVNHNSSDNKTNSVNVHVNINIENPLSFSHHNNSEITPEYLNKFKGNHSISLNAHVSVGNSNKTPEKHVALVLNYQNNTIENNVIPLEHPNLNIHKFEFNKVNSAPKSFVQSMPTIHDAKLAHHVNFLKEIQVDDKNYTNNHKVVNSAEQKNVVKQNSHQENSKVEKNNLAHENILNNLNLINNDNHSVKYEYTNQKLEIKNIHTVQPANCITPATPVATTSTPIVDKSAPFIVKSIMVKKNKTHVLKNLNNTFKVINKPHNNFNHTISKNLTNKTKKCNLIKKIINNHTQTTHKDVNTKLEDLKDFIKKSFHEIMGEKRNAKQKLGNKKTIETIDSLIKNLVHNFTANETNKSQGKVHQGNFMPVNIKHYEPVVKKLTHYEPVVKKQTQYEPVVKKPLYVDPVIKKNEDVDSLIKKQTHYEPVVKKQTHYEPVVKKNEDVMNEKFLSETIYKLVNPKNTREEPTNDTRDTKPNIMIITSSTNTKVDNNNVKNDNSFNLFNNARN